jgi:methylmalonyl-CoA mutase N-terminal domain/subunit
VKETLVTLKKTAQGKDNVVPPILEAVKAYATIGEISDTLREVLGEYRER